MSSHHGFGVLLWEDIRTGRSNAKAAIGIFIVPRHCEEPTGPREARGPMTGSATKQSRTAPRPGLLRFARNDEKIPMLWARLLPPRHRQLELVGREIVRPH